MYIKADKVCVSFGARPVLENVDFCARRGDAVLLAGDSLQRSVFLRLLAGRILPDSGSVTVCDRPAAHGRNTVYLPKRPRLIEHRTLLENVGLPLQLRGFSMADAAEIAEEQLSVFGLSRFKDYYPGQLNEDLISRAAIAEAALFAADVLLLDRPTASIADENREQVWRYLNALRLEGKTVILSTDNEKEAALLTERTAPLTPSYANRTDLFSAIG